MGELIVDYRQQPAYSPLTMMDELRERVPEIHPYAALVLTLETMVQQGEISSEEYLKWAAGLVSSHRKWLFGLN